jgi:phage gp36-like protein
MAYCTQADITSLEMTEDELVQLTDDGNVGSVDPVKVTAAITKADAEINAYCQAQYTVPFSPAPDIVKGWSATLAAFNLYRNRAKPATLVDRYNKVMSWLSAIAKAERQLPGVTDESSLPASTTDGTVQEFRKTQYDADNNLVGGPGTMDVW